MKIAAGRGRKSLLERIAEDAGRGFALCPSPDASQAKSWSGSDLPFLALSILPFLLHRIITASQKEELVRHAGLGIFIRADVPSACRLFNLPGMSSVWPAASSLSSVARQFSPNLALAPRPIVKAASKSKFERAVPPLTVKGIHGRAIT